MYRKCYHLAPTLQGRFCLTLADLYKTFHTYMPAFENLQWILLVSRQTFSNILLLKYIDLNQILDIQDLIKDGFRVLILYTGTKLYPLLPKHGSGYHANITALYQVFLSCIGKHFDMY